MEQHVSNAQDVSGNALRGATITVFDGVGAVASIFNDNGVTPKANPFLSDNSGEFAFYAADGTYTITIALAGYTTETRQGIALFDPAAPVLPANLTVAGNLTVNGNTTLGNAPADALSVSSSAVTWNGNPTHSGAHTFTSGVRFANTTISGNVLDHYEEGTFIPVLTFGGASVGITYSSQLGTFTRIGNVVFFRISIILTSKGSSTGVARITGIPVGALNVVIGGVSVGQNVTMAGLTGAVIASVASGPNQIVLNQSGATGSTDVQDTNFTNTTRLILGGSYLLA